MSRSLSTTPLPHPSASIPHRPHPSTHIPYNPVPNRPHPSCTSLRPSKSLIPNPHRPHPSSSSLRCIPAYPLTPTPRRPHPSLLPFATPSLMCILHVPLHIDRTPPILSAHLYASLPPNPNQPHPSHPLCAILRIPPSHSKSTAPLFPSSLLPPYQINPFIPVPNRPHLYQLPKLPLHIDRTPYPLQILPVPLLHTAYSPSSLSTLTIHLTYQDFRDLATPRSQHRASTSDRCAHRQPGRGGGFGSCTLLFILLFTLHIRFVLRYRADTTRTPDPNLDLEP